MAKQLNLSFKENSPIEMELYKWLKDRLNPSSFAKEILFQAYTGNTGNFFVNSNNNNTANSQKMEDTVIEETDLDDDGGFGAD